MNGKSLVTRDSALMEFSPSETVFNEYNVHSSEHATARDTLKILFRQKKVIITVFLVTLVFVYIGFKFRTPLYETNVKLLIRAEKLVESPFYKNLDNSFKSEIVLTQAEIVKSNPVLERVVKSLKLDERPLDYERAFASPVKRFFMDFQSKSSAKKIQALESNKPLRFRLALRDLGKRVKVKPIPNTNLFSIWAKDFNPEAAAKIANTVSHYYIVFDLEQQMAELSTKYGAKNIIIKQLREETQRFEERQKLGTNSYADIMGPASTKILEEAAVPLEATGFPTAVVLLLAAVCGLSLGIILAFLFEKIDPTFRSPDDVRKALNLPLLGSVPVRKFGTKLLKQKPFFSTRYTRSFQDLADHLSLLMKAEGLRSVLITACSPGDGASVVTANIATYLSLNTGHKVLIIDANLRQPTLHKLFNVPADDGFSDVLQGKVVLEKAIRRVSDQLDILPTMKCAESSLSLLNSPKIREGIRKLEESYDIIVIDSSNLKDFKDSEVLSSVLDGVVLVIEPGRARRQAVRASLEALEQKKVNILGVIFNKRVFHVPQILYRQV